MDECEVRRGWEKEERMQSQHLPFWSECGCVDGFDAVEKLDVTRLQTHGLDR